MNLKTKDSYVNVHIYVVKYFIIEYRCYIIDFCLSYLCVTNRPKIESHGKIDISLHIFLQFGLVAEA